MVSIKASEVPTARLHGYLLGAVGPRPIAFASTVDGKGRPNLSPFSFFNVFSSNPPILIFSPSRRVRDNTTKHTLENVLKNMEVVINVVNYDMVQQMSLASTEYGEGENEFVKSGLTMLPSDLVKPFRVAESPVQFECKVVKVEPLGKEGGAGNLIFSEVLKIHMDTDILDENGSIDQFKIDQVARMGGNWYSRANLGLFEVPKPNSSLGIGVDQIPGHIRLSNVLTGNDLGMLGNIEKLPSQEEVRDYIENNLELRSILSSGDEALLHTRAQELLKTKAVLSAWKVLLADIPTHRDGQKE
ncbi:flavin reductase family protein [Arenibacter sp. F20364]|uniref:flavin reductase family protein n=1 Tax=Arenibacter sp. F20364 TaxID=2926415 RepID=UPI001FF348F0|nr:flavin reductase family protein [Arenibacter sp. F20364]MCK0188793.1 flavin reductase family protein [Arenibacter sp. F20364]